MFNFFHKLRKKKELPLIGWNVKENNFLHSLSNFDNLILDLESHTDNAFKELKRGLSEIKNLLTKFDINGIKDYKEEYEKYHQNGYLENILNKIKFEDSENIISLFHN